MILIPLMLLVGAIVYGLTVASFAWEDVVFGFATSCVVLVMFRNVLLPSPLPSSRRVAAGVLAMPALVVVMVREIVVGTWQVALFVLGVRKLEHPGIVRVPVGKMTSVAGGLAGYMSTVSPGSFEVGVDEETGELLVHTIDASDPDQLRAHLEHLVSHYGEGVVPLRPEGDRQ